MFSDIEMKNIGIFGGEPLFDPPRPIGELFAPEAGAFLELARRAYDAGVLSGGALVAKLEERLAAYHEVEHCIAFANAGLALVLLMRVLAKGRSGEVIVPAFGYNGLPHFPQWAGQVPRFCDVDAQSHALDLAYLETVVSERTTSILAVCNFHDPGPIDELCAIAARHDVPIFFDSVNALGSGYRGVPLGRFGRAEVFSLHATKLLNGFEGGYVTTNNAALAQTLRESPAINAELNEMHAALALASLDRLEELIERNRARFEAYRRALAPLDGLELLEYASGRSAYPLAVASVDERWPLTRDETVRVLRAEGAHIAAYYSPALHRSPHAPAQAEVPSLPVAERLAQRYLQLPSGERTSPRDIERLGSRLAWIAENGEAVAHRLRKMAAS